MAGEIVAVLRAAGEAAPPWEASLGAPPVAVDPAAPDTLRGVACVLADGTAPDAVERVRRASRADSAVQAVIVAPTAERPRLERAILFAPGIGEVWLVAPEEVGPELVERAGGVTRRRRGYRATRERVAHALATLEPQGERRAVISDAYLAALLEAAPDPILSVDDDGTVLSWNPCAERVLGRSRREAVGRPLAEVLLPADGAPLPEILARAETVAARRELRFRRRDGKVGVGELIVLPVEAAGRRVRAVILHDLTEERRVQEELEAQATEMEAQAAELEEQAAELEATNDELQRRTEELERVAGARNRFYAAMSHELRTPVNAILGYNALLLDEIYGPLAEPQRQGLERSQRAARHLMELVNDVLDLAKIEAGRIELQTEPAFFPLLIEELLDTVRSLADQHGSELRIRGEGRHTLETDPRRVRQILLNLLSNAIKFGEGKPIDVCWERTEQGGVLVEVRDHGMGIPAADLDRIFEEFTQVGSVAQGGTGLGLPISRQLARLLGGKLEASSTVGEGSTFRLTLPPAPPQRAGSPE